jgi:hypothetical protein
MWLGNLQLLSLLPPFSQPGAHSGASSLASNSNPGYYSWIQEIQTTLNSSFQNDTLAVHFKAIAQVKNKTDMILTTENSKE